MKLDKNPDFLTQNVVLYSDDQIHRMCQIILHEVLDNFHNNAKLLIHAIVVGKTSIRFNACIAFFDWEGEILEEAHDREVELTRFYCADIYAGFIKHVTSGSQHDQAFLARICKEIKQIEEAFEKIFEGEMIKYILKE